MFRHALCILLYPPSFLLHKLLQRPAAPLPTVASTLLSHTLPSFFLLLSSLLRLFHFYCQPYRERYSYTLPLSSLLLLLLEFYCLSVALGSDSARQAAARAATSPAFASGAAARVGVGLARRRAALEERTVLDLRLEEVWSWTDLPSYLLATVFLAILLLLLTSFMLPRPPAWYTASLGLCAVACELVPSGMRLHKAATSGGSQPASLLGLLSASACALTLAAWPQPQPLLFLLSTAGAAACELAVLACAETPLLRLLPQRAAGKRGATV
jgi:hypothetical protein